ncbi:hypothetical protein ACWICO_05365 [Glutamicibacter sp. NPDC055491]
MSKNIGLENFRADLISTKSDPSLFVTTHMFNNRPRFLDQSINFDEWRHELATKLGIDPLSVFVVGSAQLGYSLNPTKNFKTFTRNADNSDDISDFDIAIVDSQLFEIAWQEMQLAMATSIPSHDWGNYRKLVFEECIALETLLPIFSFGKAWSAARDDFISYLGQDYYHQQLNYRLYRNHAALRRYQIKGVSTAKNTLEFNTAEEENA